MTTLKTVYFPGTTIFTQRQYPLFLLPCSLQLLSAIEDVPLNAHKELCDSFIKNDFCQAYTPRPLGENRERFMQLVSDITLRKDDYAAQLSHLTLASLGAKKEKETKGNILSSLLGSEMVSDEAVEERIWQARLTLKLAELLESEEEELSRNLAILEDNEEELFMTLQGELGDDDENPFADLQDLKKNMTQRSTAGDARRLAAWKTIHKYSANTDSLLLTDNKEACETVLEFCPHTEASIRLLLPAIISWDDSEAIEAIVAFKEKFSDLQTDLAKAMASGELSETLAQEWNSAIANSFSTEHFGQREVRLFQLDAGTWNTFIEKEEKSNEPTTLLFVE